MKKFIIRSIIFLVLAALLTILVYWVVHDQGTIVVPSVQPTTNNELIPLSEIEAAAQAASDMKFEIPAEGIKLSTLPLGAAQKKAIETVGIDIDTFVLTKAMLACGAGKIGSDRIEAIAGGIAPTLLETTKLLPCLSAN